MTEFLAVVALLLFVVTVTGLLITGVVHVALADGSAERRTDGHGPDGGHGARGGYPR
jgi:hypothetical protein